MKPIRSRFALLAVLALFAGPAAAEQVGLMGAANPDLTGTPPSAASRLLVTGDAVFLDEEIVSGPDGLGFAMFPDQTTLTIAPNSRIVLDRYVYDPASATGSISIGLAKGAVRLIGGRITKSSDAVIRTSTATIGIRGGAAAVSAREDGGAEVALLGGEYARIQAGGGELFVSRVGGQASIAPGGPPEFTGILDAQEAALLAGMFETPGLGGAEPSRIRGSARGLAEANSLAESSRGPAASTSGLFLDTPATLDEDFDVSSVHEVSQGAIFSDADSLNDVVINGDFVDVGGDGVVRGQLVWADSSDLDLHLILPGDAGEVFFGNRTITFNDGGAVATLDADNLGGVINVAPDKRVENIVVTGDRIPAGTYVFFVDAFSIRNTNGTDFSLTVTGDGGATTQTQTGTLFTNGENSPTLPVVVGGGGNS